MRRALSAWDGRRRGKQAWAGGEGKWPHGGLCSMLLAEVVSLPRTSNGSLMDAGCVEGGSTSGRKLPATEGCLLSPPPVAEDVSLWTEVPFSGGIRYEAKGPFVAIPWMLLRTLFSKA